MTQQPYRVTGTALEKDVLIIVACHAIYLGGGEGNTGDESEWLIEPFQCGETPTFIEHARRGVEELARSQGRAVLAFSGGATRKVNTGGRVQKTEAEGYTDVTYTHNFWGLNDYQDGGWPDLKTSLFQENYATDSYQNVLLSLIQYPTWRRKALARGDRSESTGLLGILDLELPKKLVVISHEFKRARFLSLHLPAIRSIWPSEPDVFDQMEVEFIGINPPFDEEKLKQIEEGDRKRGYGVWKEDLYGVDKLLSEKRRERGWDANDFMRYLGDWFDADALPMLNDLIQGNMHTQE